MPTWCGRLRIRTKWVPESYLPNIISYSWMKPFASMASVAGRLWAGFMTCSYCGGHSKQTVDTTRVGRTFEVALDQDLVPFTLQQTCIRCMFSLHGATIETGEHLNTFKLQVFLWEKKQQNIGRIRTHFGCISVWRNALQSVIWQLNISELSELTPTYVYGIRITEDGATKVEDRTQEYRG